MLGWGVRVLGALSMESMRITHRGGICKFAYLLKCISNPQTNIPSTYAFEGFSVIGGHKQSSCLTEVDPGGKGSALLFQLRL